MSTSEQNGPEPGGDDMVAAEYVLGVLPSDERQAAASRIAADADFARLVDHWEVALSPLADSYQPVDPPSSVKAGVDRRLFSQIQAAPAPSSGVWSSLAFWRGLSAAAIAALALYIAVPLTVTPPPQTPERRLVASLSADGTDVKYLALYDQRQGEVGLSHVSGERATGKDFELWMIEGGNAPVSMGVIPAGSTIHIVLSPEAQRKLAQGAVLAVSLEPAGGSPTGQPTGPVVAAGDLKSI